MATSASISSSFIKKARPRVPQIPGTKLSIHNTQLLVSSGIPTLDYFLGGGLAVGSVLLVEEDHYGTFGKLLLKYFVTEGIVIGHHIFLSSGSTPPSTLLKELPAVISRPTIPAPTKDAGEKLKIAWRYQNQASVEAALCDSQFGHSYDLSKTIDEEMLKNSKVFLWSPVDEIADHRDGWNLLSKPYTELLHCIKQKISAEKLTACEGSTQHSILRIAIHSLGTLLWSDDDSDAKPENVAQFLYFLRAILRTAFAVALVTVPTHLFQAFQVERMRQVCDSVVHLESFAGSEKETNPVFKDYHGLFHIIKQARLNSLTCLVPDEHDLAFKLKRKKFVIEKLHLPPDLSETASRSQGDPIISKGGCGGGGKSLLDF